jgi:hypothetical protein
MHTLPAPRRPARHHHLYGFSSACCEFLQLSNTRIFTALSHSTGRLPPMSAGAALATPHSQRRGAPSEAEERSSRLAIEFPCRRFRSPHFASSSLQ